MRTMEGAVNEQYSLASYRDAVERALSRAEAGSWVRRIWAKDAALWKDDPAHRKIIANALGWLEVAGEMLGRAGEIEAWVESVRARGYQSVFLLGMGGSSLAPEVCATSFGTRPGYLELTVLDTTDPDTILAAERKVPLERTLFLVSSKSGGTIESASLAKYFYEKLSRLRGSAAGASFAAITDAGTSLERLARDQGYARVFANPGDIGGRYSALSYFG